MPWLSMKVMKGIWLVDSNGCLMSSLIRSDAKAANHVEVGLIISEVAGVELEEKVEEREKIEEDSDYIPEDAMADNKSLECR